MNYLTAYGISEDEIKDIEGVIEENGLNKDLFIYDYEKIIEILNIFKSMGITNYYDIIMSSPSIFCHTPKSIRQRLNNN